MSPSGALTLSMQFRLARRLTLLQACWSYERMQGLGFAYGMEPWLERCYGERGPDLRQARLRHLEFFNTQPYMASLVLGMVCALEEEAAVLPPGERAGRLSRLKALKAATASALAGIGDALFWGALRSFCAALALAAGILALRCGVGGAVLLMAAVYLAAYDAPALLLRWRGLRWGYESGDQIAVRLQAFPWQAWIRRLRGAGLALAAAAGLLMLSAPGARAGQREAGVVMLAAYLAALFSWPKVLSAYRLYAATCVAGTMAAAAGWI